MATRVTAHSATCPACASRETHVLARPPLAAHERAFDCVACGWLRWGDDDFGCDTCRLHWGAEGHDPHSYSPLRAALLLGVGRVEIEALLRENPHLARNKGGGLPDLHRTPIHVLAALLA